MARPRMTRAQLEDRLAELTDQLAKAEAVIADYQRARRDRVYEKGFRAWTSNGRARRWAVSNLMNYRPKLRIAAGAIR